jgi:hypothetical protein
MNRNLIEEIRRFRLLTNYDSQVTLSENYSKIILTEKKKRKQYCYRNEDGSQFPIAIFEDGNFQATEAGKKMGILTANDFGELMGSTYEDGTLKIVQCDGYIAMDKTKVEVDKNKDNQNDLSRRDIRRNKRANDREIKQNLEGANWLGGNSGTLFMGTSRYPNAYNVGKNIGYIFVGVSEKFDIKKSDSPKDEPTPPLPPIPTLYPYEVNSDYKVFPDNIVNVDFAKFPNAMEEFNEIVDAFVEYIKAGGADKLTNVTIQGQADSANPTWKAPAGYTTIDHNYGGVRRPKKNNPQTQDELEKMNLYLAEKRAHNYAVLLKEEIKKQTGVDIDIKELDPISYLGQGESKRGAKYRSLLINPNAPKLEKIEPGLETEFQQKQKEKFDRKKVYQSKFNPIDIYIGIDGVSKLFSQSEKTLGPIALSAEIPNSNLTTTNKGVYMRSDYVNYFKIPEKFGDFVSKATVNGSVLTITDEGGKVNKFDMVSFDESGNWGNVVALENVNNEFRDPYMGASRNRGGQDCAGAYGTKVPLTTHTDEVISYNGKTYFRLKNYWFASIAKYCGKFPPKVNYFKEPRFEKYADEDLNSDLLR